MICNQDNSNQLNTLLLCYCIIDYILIVINCTVMLIYFLLLVTIRKLLIVNIFMKTVKFTNNTARIETNKLFTRSEYRTLHSNRFYASLKQILICVLILCHSMLFAEIIIIWRQFGHKFSTLDAFTVLCVLLTTVIVTFCRKLFATTKVSALQTFVLFIYWFFAAFWSLSKFVLICLYKDNYHQLLRVYLIFLLFVIYTLLSFAELATLLKPNYKPRQFTADKVVKYSTNRNQSPSPPYIGDHYKYRRHYSSLVSKATFCWFFPLLKLGYTRPLELHDLDLLPPEETSEFQFSRFLRCTENRKKWKALDLWKCYWKTYRDSLMIGAFIKILADLFGLIGPLSINMILNYISDTQTKSQNITGEPSPPLPIHQHDSQLNLLTNAQFFTNGYIIACIVLISTIMQSTFSNNFNHLVIAEGIHLKTALQSFVYKKTLAMTAHNGIDMGSNVNHISIDASNMFMLFSMGHYIWAVPFKILLLLYLLYHQLGYSAMIGAATIYVLAPVQYYISTLLSKLQKKELEISDERLRKTSELFMGIKLLKLLGWELAFAKSINDIREKEIKILKLDSIYIALNTFLTQASSIVVTLVTFALYPYIEGKNLSSAKVFTGLALFNQLTVPLYIIPMVIPILISAIISTKRLAKFLSTPEVCADIPWRKERSNNINNNGQQVLLNTNLRYQNSDQTKDYINTLKDNTGPNAETNNIEKPKDVFCSIKDGNFGLAGGENFEEITPILSNINIRVPEEKLTIIVGSVGSGKSSFIRALLGEMIKTSGEINWCEKTELIGYVSSTPWLFNVTLHENITFGYPYDKKRYEKVLNACALNADIEILPAGDNTLIGDRGINLSGGQKQRIALARAIYSPANTVILDDPLSALDPHVGQHVFDKAIKELLIDKKRTVLLVTHKLEYLPQSSNIIVFNSGTISHHGSYRHIQYTDPSLFAKWNEVKNSEEEARRTTSVEESVTHKERHKLKRMLSKQVAFRGSVSDAMPMKNKKRITFSRQMSHDPLSPLPCHDWSEHDDNNHLNQEDISEESHKRVSNSFRRMRSIDSVESKSSYGISSIISSSPDTTKWSRQPVVRLNSRISDYSYSGVSIKEEDESDDQDIEANENDNHYYGISPQEVKDRDSSLATIQLLSEEERQTGSISKSTYITYIRACSMALTILVLSLIMSTHGAKVSSDFWLANWSKWSEGSDALTTDSDLSYYIKGYAILSLITIVISLATNLSSQMTSIRAMKLLHYNMLDNVVRLPMRFFDTTPFGRIINRFSSDMNIIDKKLPIALPVLLRFLLLCISAIIVDIIITPYFIIAVIPIIIIYYYLQHFFRFTSRELQRLDAITKSPIYSHFSQTIQGITTIRSYRRETDFTDRFYEFLDVNNLCFLMVNSANCWLGIALDYLGGIILFCATIAAITAAVYGNISAAYVGMAMTYTLLVPIYLNWVVRNLASVEMYMSSVERIDEYSKMCNEDHESAMIIENKFVGDEWPKFGEIEFKNVFLKYGSNAEPIIKGVSFSIKAGEKVGICGRTGCGKSTLMSALFRINQISGGSILIDDIDITHVSSQTLRTRLSIIPQDVVLFSGTIRENLDPANLYSDDHIWQVLNQLNLNQIITSLSEVVYEDGHNYSLGQRQLICMARALLRKSSILILDEASSALDNQTQHAMKTIIAGLSQTVISIAHRIDSIISFDKIIVLDSGVIAEIGSPQQLIAKTDSIFNSLRIK